MTNLQDAETRINVGESTTLFGTKHGNRHGCQKLDGKLHWVMLSNIALIPGLHANLFSVIREVQKVCQVMSEGEALILKNNSTKTKLTRKWQTVAAKEL